MRSLSHFFKCWIFIWKYLNIELWYLIVSGIGDHLRFYCRLNIRRIKFERSSGFNLIIQLKYKRGHPFFRVIKGIFWQDLNIFFYLWFPPLLTDQSCIIFFIHLFTRKKINPPFIHSRKEIIQLWILKLSIQDYLLSFWRNS